VEAEKKRDKTREEEAKTLQELEKLRKVPLLLSLNKKKTDISDTSFICLSLDLF
jgi:hypothetical protein